MLNQLIKMIQKQYLQEGIQIGIIIIVLYTIIFFIMYSLSQYNPNWFIALAFIMIMAIIFFLVKSDLGVEGIKPKRKIQHYHRY
jgi:cell division protein FtsW (lipid II flippase)